MESWSLVEVLRENLQSLYLNSTFSALKTDYNIRIQFIFQCNCRFQQINKLSKNSIIFIYRFVQRLIMFSVDSQLGILQIKDATNYMHFYEIS